MDPKLCVSLPLPLRTIESKSETLSKEVEEAFLVRFFISGKLDDLGIVYYCFVIETFNKFFSDI